MTTVGVPKEIKTREYRVGMTPAGVRQLTARGHKVLVEKSAGDGSGLPDAQYVAAGAQIVPTAADAWGAEMVVKVKEPLKAEYGFFRKDLTRSPHRAVSGPAVRASLSLFEPPAHAGEDPHVDAWRLHDRAQAVGARSLLVPDARPFEREERGDRCARTVGAARGLGSF